MDNIDLNLTCFISLERAFCGDSDHVLCNAMYSKTL